MSNVIDLRPVVQLGISLSNGWHWLQRRSDGAMRLGFFNQLGGWRVSDAIGRTELMGRAAVAREYRVVAALPLPLSPADINGEDA